MQSAFAPAGWQSGQSRNGGRPTENLPMGIFFGILFLGNSLMENLWMNAYLIYIKEAGGILQSEFFFGDTSF